MTAKCIQEVAVGGSETCQLLEAYYFDTPTYCLQKAKFAYRIRKEDMQWIATVKGGGSSAGGLHERQEWNVPTVDAQPSIAVFADTPIGHSLEQIVGQEHLQCVLMTRFERKTIDVLMPDGSQIEVAADHGEIIAGGKTTPILEIELELKAGQPAMLFVLGAALSKEYPVIPEPKSKFYRGLILAGLASEPSSKMTPLPEIDKNMSAAAAFRTLLVHLIAHILVRQQAFFDEPTEPEHVHELRISLRRLRSLLQFMKPLLSSTQYKTYQEHVREVGKMLGVLRDIDVAYRSWQDIIGDQMVRTVPDTYLKQQLLERRQLEATTIYAALHAGLLTPVLLDLWAMVTDKKSSHLAGDHMTVGAYCIARVSKGLTSVIKQGKAMDWDIGEHVQKLRVGLRSIQYAIILLRSTLYDIDPLLLRLDVLQNKLGVLSDVHNTDVLFTKLLREHPDQSLGLEVGIISGWQRCQAFGIENKMDKYWGKFYRTAQRWV